MSDRTDDFDGVPAGDEEIDDTPTITCTRCDREWDLGYELDDLRAGNRALEQFALDHERHTGHFPDGVTPWIAACRRCPGGDRFLPERPARRWAETHARHTRHAVELRHGEDEATVVEPGEERTDGEGRADGR